ncbi:MAG TPA: cytochrome bc complex cytochrome b subunit [Candidatus Limnocylindrales bacterium]|nr:cytochrome bc complex cytochrome b subunit [Candidatus Limnocylindrales bacterium]
MTTDAPTRAPLGGPIGWIENRLHLGPFIGALLHVRVPADAKTFYLGGITLFLFGIQVVTGTLLALYYSPTPDAAYESVLSITSDVQFGWLIRSIHHWTANLMILSLILHVIRIFVQGAYKYPREATWLVGGGLLMLTIGFGFTGYLLPWDQRAYWATVVGTEIAGAVPLIGPPLLLLLRGGPDVTDATLARFFGIHVLVLPLLIGALIAIHLLFVHQQGLANPKRPDPRPGRPGPDLSAEKTKPFFPDYILDELIAWYAVLTALVVLATIFPAGLEAKADPLITPEHIKPEWYFLGVYELLKLVPETVGVVAPIALVLVIVILPLLDRNHEVRPRRRPIAIGLATLLLVGLGVLTVLGGRS